MHYFNMAGCRKIGFLIAILCLSGWVNATWSQTKKPATTPAKTTPASFVVKYGPYKDKMPIVLSDLKLVLNSELKVTDSATGQAFTIISFRFGWRKKEPSDDVKTGKKKIITSYNAVDVYNKTRLPEAWQTELKESAKSSDELSFEAIFVQHPLTQKLYQVPSISFKVL